MRNYKKPPSTIDGKHWLTIGSAALHKARSQGSSQSVYEPSALEDLADRYGKSISTIRKIIDATAWVEDFYPDILSSPPEKFPLTQALQLRSIHRLDPYRAKNLASSVFSGKLVRQDLVEVLDELSEGRYRPVPDKPNDTERIVKKRLSADTIETDEEMIHYLLDCTLATVEDLAGRARPPKMEVSRQCLIAQTIVDHLRFSSRPPFDGRAEHLEAHNWAVADWAASLKN